jgi:hypothetical protein
MTWTLFPALLLLWVLLSIPIGIIIGKFLDNGEDE